MRKFLSLAALVGIAACASQHRDIKSILQDLPSSIIESENDISIPKPPEGSLPAPEFPKYFSPDSLTEKRREILKKLYFVVHPIPNNQDPSDEELLSLQKDVLFRVYGSKDPDNGEAVFPRISVENLHYGAFDIP